MRPDVKSTGGVPALPVFLWMILLLHRLLTVLGLMFEGYIYLVLFDLKIQSGCIAQSL